MRAATLAAAAGNDMDRYVAAKAAFVRAEIIRASSSGAGDLAWTCRASAVERAGDGHQSLVGRRPLLDPADEQAERRCAPPADPAAQLVQLRDAEAVGVLDDHERRVRDVDPDLDLSADDLGHGRVDPAGEGRRVDGDRVAGDHQQRRRAVAAR